MPRVSLTPRRTLFARLVEWYARRTYGKALDSVRALAHHLRMLRSDLRLQQSVAKWNRVAPTLIVIPEEIA